MDNILNMHFLSQDELEEFQGDAVARVAAVNHEDKPVGNSFPLKQVSVILQDQGVMCHTSWTDGLVILFGLISALYLFYLKL